LPLNSDILRQAAVSPETEFSREEDGAVPEGRHYSCRASGGGSVVLGDEATPDQPTLKMAR
jgi:hypothetical protein